MAEKRHLLRITIDGLGATALRSGDEIRIGRHPGNDIVVDDSQCSRRHARFFWEALDARAQIEDLGSSNGVMVNGIRIEKPRQLATGDRVQIGPVVMEVSYQVDTSPSRRVRRPTYAAQLTGEPARKGWLSPRLTLKSLLENLGDESKSGILLLGPEDEGRLLVFRKGRIIDAEAFGNLKGSAALGKVLEKLPEGAMYRLFLQPNLEGPLDLSPRTLFMEGKATSRWDASELRES